MPTLQTITTIELSNQCNLSCEYCINRLMLDQSERKPGVMDGEIFGRAVGILRILVKRGTQREINLNGNGESLFDPKLVSRVKHVKQVVGTHGIVQFTTNGYLMTNEIARQLREAGVDRVDVSAHQIPLAIRANYILRKNGVPGIVTVGHVQTPHNWAGQLDVVPEVPFRIPCIPMIEGRGYIQMEGDIVPCCYDYRNTGKFGHVFDEDLFEKEIKPFALCHTCHQVNPFLEGDGNHESHNNRKCGSGIHLQPGM